jgi:PleD family two-component response regulator
MAHRCYIKIMTKILAIGSQLHHSNTFVKLLESKGFDVIVAENAAVGVFKAHSELPDLIISDFIMQDLDGYGVLKALREHPLTAIIPFIFLANKASQAQIRKAMEMGTDDFITKPYTEEEFLKAVVVRLERQAFLREWYAARAAKQK